MQCSVINRDCETKKTPQPLVKVNMFYRAERSGSHNVTINLMWSDKSTDVATAALENNVLLKIKAHYRLRRDNTNL